MSDAAWAEQRRKNAEARAQLMRARTVAESATASDYLRKFVRAATEQGLQEEELVVTRPGTSRRARTGLRGWYLKENRSMGVDGEGRFYLLTAPLSLRESMFGVSISPADPPLILGKGGRDGESIDLVDALTKLVPNWRDFSAD